MSAASAAVRPMREADLEMVLRWRNAPGVREGMFTRHTISEDEHRRWFAAAAGDRTRHLLVFELDGAPCGFVGLRQVAEGGIAEWGFYVAPEAPAGCGRRLGEAAIAHAFGALGLHKVCGEVIATNEKSIRFHRSQGFEQEGVLREQYFDGERYHDVLRFGLLASDWRRSRAPGAADITGKHA